MYKPFVQKPQFYVLLVIVTMLVLVLLIGCNPCSRLSRKCDSYVKLDTIVRTDSVIQRDTIIKLEEDLYTLEMLLDCDSAYNVVLKNLHEEKGKGKIKTVVRLIDNTVKFKAQVDSILELNRLIEYYKNQKIYIQSPMDEELIKDNKKLNKKNNIFKVIIFVFSGMIIILFTLVIIFVRKILKNIK